jgi:hypothetical protein
MGGGRGGTGKCGGPPKCKATYCTKSACVKAREKTGKAPSRVQFVLTVTSLYFNDICKNRKKDKPSEKKETSTEQTEKSQTNIEKDETSNKARSKINLLPYQTVTQKVQVMFDRTINADPVQTKRIKCHHLNCEHRKAPGTWIETVVKFAQNRRCLDTIKKIRESEYWEKWIVDNDTKTVKVESDKEKCVLNSFLKCKQPLCRVSALSALPVNIVIKLE